MIYGSTYKVKVALNGYRWNLKIPSRSDHTLRRYATLCTPPKRRGASMQGGHHLHTCTTSTSQGAPMVKALTTLSTQWSNRVYSDGVGASENPRELKQKKENTLATQISMKPSSGLYRSSMIGLQSASICRSPPECSHTSI